MEFSIVIPLYNTEKFIKRTVDSVINQRYPAKEIIVVDDGSTDNGPAIVEEIIKSNPTVRLLKQKNKLVGAARNYGTKAATGDLIGFLDADDEYLPEFLETVAGMHKDFPEASAFATAYRVQKADRFFIPKFSSLPKFPWEGIVSSYYKSALNYHPLSSSSIVIKKEALEAVGGFPEGVRYGVDLDTWARIAAKYEIAFSSKVCAVYHRDVGTSLSVEKRSNFDRKVEETLEILIKNKQYKQKDEKYIRQYSDKLHIDTALKYLKSGNKEKMNEHLDQLMTNKFFIKKLKIKVKSFVL